MTIWVFASLEWQLMLVSWQNSCATHASTTLMSMAVDIHAKGWLLLLVGRVRSRLLTHQSDHSVLVSLLELLTKLEHICSRLAHQATTTNISPWQSETDANPQKLISKRISKALQDLMEISLSNTVSKLSEHLPKILNSQRITSALESLAKVKIGKCFPRTSWELPSLQPLLRKKKCKSISDWP